MGVESSVAEANPYAVAATAHQKHEQGGSLDDMYDDTEEGKVQTNYIRVDGEKARMFEDDDMLDDDEGSIVRTSLVKMAFNGIWSIRVGTGKSPAPRTGHFCAYSEQYHAVFIGYGQKRGGDLLNDVWALSTDNWQWNKLKLTGTPVDPRVGSSACMMGNYIVVFGGFARGNFLADLHTIDITTGEVLLADTRGSIPQPRARPVISIYKKRLYIWGGNNGKGVSDLHILDFATMRWAVIKTSVKGRQAAPWAVYDNRIFCYGAAKSGGFAIVDMENASVMRTNACGTPPPNLVLNAGMCRAGEYLFYFGGKAKNKWTMMYACEVERLWWFVFFVAPDGETTSASDGRISSDGIFLLPRTNSFSTVYVEHKREIAAFLGHPHKVPIPIYTIYIGDALAALHLRDDMCAMFQFGLSFS